MDNVESAGFGIRLAARLLDYGPLIVIAGLSLGVISFFVSTPAADTSERLAERFVLRIAAIVASVLYHAFSESVGGATLGKRLLGLEVVSEDLRPATLLQGWKRSLAILIDGFFFGLIGYNAMKKSELRQRIGDEWAGTRVVLRRSLPPALRRPTLIFAFAFFAAVGIAAEGFALVQIGTNWLFA